MIKEVLSLMQLVLIKGTVILLKIFNLKDQKVTKHQKQVHYSAIKN